MKKLFFVLLLMVSVSSYCQIDTDSLQSILYKGKFDNDSIIDMPSAVMLDSAISRHNIKIDYLAGVLTMMVNLGPVPPPPTFIPSDINPQLWIDMVHSDQFTPINFALGRVVSSVNNRGVSGKTVTAFATDKYPRWNGEGFYFSSVYGLKSGVVGDYNLLHNGSPFVWFKSFKVLPTIESSTVYTLARTNAGGSSGVGINMYYVNDPTLNRRNALQFTITNGSAAIINIVSTQQALVQDAYNDVMIVYDGTVCTMYCNGVQVGTATRTLTSSAANHTNVLTLYCNQSGTSGTMAYGKHEIIYNYLLSASERTQVRDYLLAQNQITITPTPVNVYLAAGQSNLAGRGSNGQLASDLLNPTNAFMYNGSQTLAGYWDNVRKEISSLVGQTTEHGFNMRWGKEAGTDLYLITYGVSGTTIENWHPTAGVTYLAYKNVYTQAFNQLYHELRKTPTIRGFVFAQGESNAQLSDASTYQAGLETLTKGIADDLNALGYSTSKMRVSFLRIRDQYPGFNATALSQVRSAQVYVGDNFLTDFPSYCGKVKSTRWVDTDSIPLQADNIHYSAAGLDTMGDGLFDYYDQYKNE